MSMKILDIHIHKLPLSGRVSSTMTMKLPHKNNHSEVEFQYGY